MIEKNERIDIKGLVLNEPKRIPFRPTLDPETQLRPKHREWINDTIGVALYFLEDHHSATKDEIIQIAPVAFALSKSIKIPEQYANSHDVISAHVRTLINNPDTETEKKIIYMGGAKLLFPEVFAEIQDSLPDRFEEIKEELVAYQQNIMVVPSPEFDSVTFASLLYPDRRSEFIKDYYIDGHKAMYIATQIEFEEVHNQHSKSVVLEPQLRIAAENLAIQASHLAIISPEVFTSEPIAENTWNKLTGVLFHVADHISFPVIASGMAVIAADDIKITDQGVEIIYAKRSKQLDTEKTKIPERRSF